MCGTHSWKFWDVMNSCLCRIVPGPRCTGYYIFVLEPTKYESVPSISPMNYIILAATARWQAITSIMKVHDLFANTGLFQLYHGFIDILYQLIQI